MEGGSANDYDYVSGDPVNGRDLDGHAQNNKQKRKVRDGLRRQVEEHESKIRNERARETPNQGLVDHWQKEIDNWNTQIDKLNKRLRGGNAFTRFAGRLGRGGRRLGEAVTNLPRILESADCPRGGIACTR